MSYIINKLYTTLFYFELGRSTGARFYAWLPDVFIILGGLKYLFGIDMSWQLMAGIIIAAFIGFTCAGYLLKYFKWYDIDRKVQVKKDPIMSEVYGMAIEYNKKNKNDN